MILNSSNCSISSLEVYQGRKKTIEISHEGFSVSDNGGIKVIGSTYTYHVHDDHDKIHYYNRLIKAS